jgi:N-acetylneuraminate synthase
MSIYVIAEAGVNHNGSLDMARQLVEVAAEAGADAVKFQTFKASNLVSKTAPKAAYQLQTTEQTESQYEMIKKLELPAEHHRILIDHANKHGIEFLSTPFDEQSLNLLIGEFGLKTIKIPSGEITNGPFLLQVAQTGSRIILSTGMSTLGEIEEALSVLAFGFLHDAQSTPSHQNFEAAYFSDEGQQALLEHVTLLHCTTEYPAPFADVNLRAMDTMAAAFGLPVGYSDHTNGIHIPIAAAARGAVLIEKHFTLDRDLPGPDHRASLEHEELKAMVQGIRDTEQALGSGLKRPAPSETLNRQVVRKSLIATRAISKGTKFTSGDITCKRPGNGISPMSYWNWLGQQANRDFETDDCIDS